MKTNEKTNSWSISDFYKKSWSLTKRHKKLWIFGLAVALFGSSGDYDSSSSSDSESSSEREEQAFFQKPEVVLAQDATMQYSFEESSSNTLGEEVSDMFAPYIEAYTEQPLLLHVLTVIGVLASVVTFTILGIGAFGWSNAALISSINTADTNDIVDMFATSELAKTKIKPLLWLYIMPVLKLVLLLVGICLVIGIGIAVTDIPLLALLFIPVVFVFIWKVIRVAYAQIVGSRYLVYTDSATGKEALEKGFEITKTSKSRLFRLGFANVISITLVFLISLIPVGMIGFYLYDSMFAETEPSMMVLIAIIAAAIILFTPIYFAVTAIYKVFNYSTWHYAYLSLTQDNEG